MQRDYIMRMIEQAIAGLIAIVIKAESGQFQQAKQDFDQICRDTIGLDLEKVKSLTPDAVAILLKDSGSLRFTRSIILAAILLHEADVLERSPHTPFPLANFVHAFCLISDSIEVLSYEDEALYRVKLDYLADRLQAFREMPQLSERFSRFYGSAEQDAPANP
jgi:hypothetical protein